MTAGIKNQKNYSQTSLETSPSFLVSKTMQGRQLSIFYGCQLIYRVIAQIFYSMVMGLANVMTCYHYERQQKVKREEENKWAVVVYNPQNPVQASFKKSVENQVKEAEAQYQKNQRALEHVLRLKAPGVPNVAIHGVERFFIPYFFRDQQQPTIADPNHLTKQISFTDYVVKRVQHLSKEELQPELAAIFTEYQQLFNAQLPVDQVKTLFQEAMTLICFLQQTTNQFTPALPEQDLQNQMKEIFGAINNFYTRQIKPFCLTKGSTENKRLQKNKTTFAEQMNKQQKIFKTPSSDPYIQNTLRPAVAVSLAVLKQKQALLKTIKLDTP